MNHKMLWALLGVLSSITLILSRHKTRTFPSPFRAFQREYLAVFYTVMLADWLQGITMYDLYRGYVQDVSTVNMLFLTGFATSGIVSMVCGQYVDRWGRKKSCVVYCLLEIVINILEHVPNVRALFVGRLLGGCSTALLFVAFESWMVSEHHRRGFKKEWLKDTCSLAHAGNGIVAVFAGIMAHFLKHIDGDIGPFRAAIVLTVGILMYIGTQWPENYGQTEHVRVQLDRTLLWLGCVQTLFESAMYTFVFNWVPALETQDTGLVFACFMVCVALGSVLFRIYVVDYHGSTIWFGACVSQLAAIALAAVGWDHTSFVWTLGAFLVFELCVGANMACQAALRSQRIPQHQHASVMHMYRVPLNILTVLGIWTSGQLSWTMFACAVACQLAACAHRFI